MASCQFCKVDTQDTAADQRNAWVLTLTGTIAKMGPKISLYNAISVSGSLTRRRQVHSRMHERVVHLDIPHYGRSHESLAGISLAAADNAPFRLV